MLRFKAVGKLSKTEKFLDNILKDTHFTKLDKYGRQGVAALRNATPRDTGLTAESWEYEIRRTKEDLSIIWRNTNRNKDVSIAFVIQYGHGMPNGGYVRGIDYINPAMRSVFDDIGKGVWEEVTKR